MMPERLALGRSRKEIGMFKSSLRRDVVLVVLAKVAILMIIKNVWFDAPSIPENGSVRVADHLLDSRGLIPEAGQR